MIYSVYRPAGRKSVAVLAVAAASLLVLAACGDRTEVETDTYEAAQTPDANPAATVATPADEASSPDFVRLAASNDMYEIESSRLAVQRATDPRVRSFAQKMIDGHTQTTAELKSVIAASGQPMTLPATLPDALRGKINDLTNVTGADFDRRYIEAQVDAHQTALNLMQRYANDGDAAALKSFAAKTAPIIQQHLTEAEGLQGVMNANAG